MDTIGPQQPGCLSTSRDSYPRMSERQRSMSRSISCLLCRTQTEPRIIMFGFGSSSSDASTSTSSTNATTPAAPNREERAQCWTSRDAYFACLDKNGIIAAGSESGKGPCDGEKKGYEGSCSRSWVGGYTLILVRCLYEGAIAEWEMVDRVFQ